jgi:hypothetical protein
MLLDVGSNFFGLSPAPGFIMEKRWYAAICDDQERKAAINQTSLSAKTACCRTLHA